MKGFIKITDLKNDVHYLNLDYIIQFNSSGTEWKGNSVLFISGGQRVVTIATNSTVEEIVEMIDLAKK